MQEVTARQRRRSSHVAAGFAFARVGAALGMTVADVYTQYRYLWIGTELQAAAAPRRHAKSASPTELSRAGQFALAESL